MKAWNTVTLILAINIAIFILGSITGITTFGGTDPAIIYSLAIIGTILGMMVGGAVVSRITGANIAKFTAFSGLFWGIWTGNTVTFNSIETSFGGTGMYSIMFLAFGLITYVMAMIQLESGGMDSAL